MNLMHSFLYCIFCRPKGRICRYFIVRVQS